MNLCEIMLLGSFTQGCVLPNLFTTPEQILDIIMEYNQKAGKTSRQKTRNKNEVPLFLNLDLPIDHSVCWMAPLKTPQAPTLIKSKVDCITVNGNYSCR